MIIDADALTRAQVGHVLGMSDGWVAQRMRAGDLPRPGLPAAEYVRALVRYRARRNV